MRSICKKGSATLVAVLALCALTAASASAAQWYVNGKALTGSATISQTTKMEEKVEISYYNGKSVLVTVGCTSLTGYSNRPFEIVAPTTLKIGDFLFEGCKVIYPKTLEGCKIDGGKEEIGTNPVSALFATGTSPEDHGEFARREGTKRLWEEFGFEECALEGRPFTIAGTLPVKLPHGQTASTEQELVFEKAAGLTDEGEPVYLTGKVKLKLTSGSTWALH